jgi:dipeptidyl aminopeptidase/acylaminoacyl peptidase
MAAHLIWLALLAAAPQSQPPPQLISRALFFKNPERANPQLSPDGSRLAWLQPDARGALQIWTKKLEGKDDARQLTADEGRGIRRYFWAFNGDILYLQDHDGDENFRLYSLRVTDGKVRDLTSVAGIRPCDIQLSPEQPGKALVVRGQARRLRSLSGRSGKDLFDAWLIDLKDGELTPADANPGDVGSWIVDAQLQVRGRVREKPDGGGSLELRDAGQKEWRTVLSWGLLDQVEPLGLTQDGKHLYLLDNLGADTVSLDLLDLATGKTKRLAVDPTADAYAVDAHPATRQVRAIAFDRARIRWQAVDPTVAADLAALAKVDPGDLELLGGDQADKTWVVLFDRDTSPGRYYLWDRANKKATLLFTSHPALEKVELAPMRSLEIRARDGLSLPSYLTLPPGQAPKGLPLVVYVHGGPWTRDTWGYDGAIQWLASRGYAVLQVNYRGSQGFGKKFKNAALKQFARRMHDDLVDGVRWAVKAGVADPKRVAILGDSYGGYATLVGLTFTPEVFSCGVDMFGPSNLATLVESFPAYWGPFLASTWHPFVGDPNEPKDRADMESRSPLFKADAIRAPLLIGQGGNDPRVARRESEQMVAAIQKSGGAVTYVLYPDEGHGFVRPANRLDFFARTEGFLAECLGGRAEPMAQERVAGSSAVVKVVKPAAKAPSNESHSQ